MIAPSLLKRIKYSPPEPFLIDAIIPLEVERVVPAFPFGAYDGIQCGDGLSEFSRRFNLRNSPHPSLVYLNSLQYYLIM
jgi:hypothetical protein